MSVPKTSLINLHRELVSQFVTIRNLQTQIERQMYEAECLIIKVLKTTETCNDSTPEVE